MELIAKSYLDNETKEIVTERFFVDSNEISEGEYLELIDGSESKDEHQDCNYCDKCEAEVEVEIETIEELAEIMANTLMEEIDKALENGECPCCVVKEKLTEAFLAGYETGRDDVEDIILESLGY